MFSSRKCCLSLRAIRCLLLHERQQHVEENARCLVQWDISRVCMSQSLFRFHSNGSSAWGVKFVSFGTWKISVSSWALKLNKWTMMQVFLASDAILIQMMSIKHLNVALEYHFSLLNAEYCLVSHKMWSNRIVVSD